MRTLKDIIQSRQALLEENSKREQEYGQWCAAFKADMHELTEAEALLARGVDLDRLLHGQHVIYIRGDYRRAVGESASWIREAKADLVAGAPKLKKQYFGAKDYDRWSGQRSDHPYGYCPSHGSIVFAIGLTDAARQMDLTDEMIEDALYVLANIDKVLDAREKAKEAA